MASAVTSGLTTVITSVGSVVTALTSESGELAGLLIFVGLSVGASLFGFAIKGIKSIGWGY